LAETILAIVDDLFFLAKIQQTAKLVGVTVEPIAPEKVAERAAQVPVRALILDLNHRSGSALQTLRAIKADAKIGAIQVLGFLSHVQTDLAAAAREAGCDVVLARSTFSQRLPELLKEPAGRVER
jgi:DNA-binding NarL/FixJ family response regulator